MRKRYFWIFITAVLLIQSFIPVLAEDMPQKREVPILLYHSVENSIGTYYVAPEKLKGDILSLKNAGYTPVLFEDLIRFVYHGGELPEKPVVITFDDGYKNNYDTLLPMAIAMDFKFEVFGIVGGISYNPNRMTWAEALYVNNSPLANIGCHTHDLHYDTPERRGVKRNPGEDFGTWEHMFRTDLRYADTTLYENLSEHPTVFAYPFGAFSAEADKILRESGYLVSVTTEPGVNTVTAGDSESLYLMMRISMDGREESAAEMIRLNENIHYSYAAEGARDALKKISYASRKDALCALYSDDFAGMDADISYLNWYFDTKYLDAETARILSLCILNGKINGFEDYTIRPYHYITRAEFAAMLARHCGYDGGDVKYEFDDASDWNRELLSWCSEKGYMKGYGDGRFGADDLLTQEQLQLICQRIEK